MSRCVSIAVILAAGMGTRLKEVSNGKPKGFIKLGAKTIIEESLLKLRKSGIDQVIIVSGYGAEHYVNLKNAFTGIEIVFNDRYASSGSMYSLYCARRRVHGKNFLLLESDLIYEHRALEEVIEFGRSNCVLLSNFTLAGDEVFAGVRDGLLIGLSKKKSNVENCVGEMVGISKISSALFAKMLEIARETFKTTLRLDYETCLLAAAQEGVPVHCRILDDLAWAEIDDAYHFERARSTVYPRIAMLDQSIKEEP